MKRDDSATRTSAVLLGSELKNYQSTFDAVAPCDQILLFLEGWNGLPTPAPTNRKQHAVYSAGVEYRSRCDPQRIRVLFWQGYTFNNRMELTFWLNPPQGFMTPTATPDYLLTTCNPAAYIAFSNAHHQFHHVHVHLLGLSIGSSQPIDHKE